MKACVVGCGGDGAGRGGGGGLALQLSLAGAPAQPRCHAVISPRPPPTRAPARAVRTVRERTILLGAERALAMVVILDRAGHGVAGCVRAAASKGKGINDSSSVGGDRARGLIVLQSKLQASPMVPLKE